MLAVIQVPVSLLNGLSKEVQVVLSAGGKVNAFTDGFFDRVEQRVSGNNCGHNSHGSEKHLNHCSSEHHRGKQQQQGIDQKLPFSVDEIWNCETKMADPEMTGRK